MATPCMETVDPGTRRANLKLLLVLIAFALGLTALCIIWMHYHSERIYQEQVKPASSFFLQPAGPVAHSSNRVFNPLDSKPFSC